jgi:hypothetical protein
MEEKAKMKRRGQGQFMKNTDVNFLKRGLETESYLWPQWNKV